MTTTQQTPYADYDYAVDKYGEDYVLTSVTRDSKPDKKAFYKALVNATSFIDSHVAPRYPGVVPLANPPDIIRGYCVDIAIYNASAEPGTATDEKRKRFDDAVEWLEKVGAGKVAIMTLEPDGSESDAGDTNMPIMNAQPRLFTRHTTRGMF